MNRIIIQVLFVIVCLLTFGSCKNTNSSGPYSMNWTQDSTSYSATSDNVISVSDSAALNSINIQGQANNGTISLYIFNYKRNTGTFPISLTSVYDTINSASAIYLASGAASRNALYGTATITSVSAALIQGTFSFTCTDSTKITNGTFTCKAQ
jgi:hypothetical protein